MSSRRCRVSDLPRVTVNGPAATLSLPARSFVERAQPSTATSAPALAEA